MRQILTLIAFLMIISSPSFAETDCGYMVILTNGERIEALEEPVFKNGSAIFTNHKGLFSTLPAHQVDRQASKQYNDKNPCGANVLFEDTPIQVPNATPKPSLSKAVVEFGPPPKKATEAAATATPTPAIAFRDTSYADERITAAFRKYLEDHGLILFKLSTGTQAEHLFVGATTDSPDDARESLEMIIRACHAVWKRAPKSAPKKVEILLSETSGKSAGTFVVTPEIAAEFVSSSQAVGEFYVQNVIID